MELGGTPAPNMEIEQAALALLEDRHAGVLLVGVPGVGWQSAMHVPGPYALIQELWVHPSWRSRAIGSNLFVALFELAGERRISRIEVGLPRERLAGIDASETFYRCH